MPKLLARLRARLRANPGEPPDMTGQLGVPGSGSGNPTPPDAVRLMFARLAPRYDLMNTLMTGGLDARWRRAAVDAADLRPGMRVLDLACGTGLLARAAAGAVGPHGEVVCVDVVPQMLALARRRRPQPGFAPIRWEVGDALSLPFAQGAFDVVLIGFGLRNLPDYDAGLREMARVTRPGGAVVALEIAVPRAPLPRLLHATWFRRVVPPLGRLLGAGADYAYLPSSLDDYPRPEAVAELMADAGLSDVRWRWLSGGMTTLHVGRGPA